MRLPFLWITTALVVGIALARTPLAEAAVGTGATALLCAVAAGALAANVPASLLSAAIVPLGFLALLLDAVWNALGAAAGAAVGWLASAMLAAVEWFSRAEWSAWRVPPPPAWLLAAQAAAVISLAASLRAQKPRRRAWIWLSAAALSVAAWLVATHPFPAQLAPRALEITTLDVGQGDAIFVAFPDGRTLLVDGGGLFGAGGRGGFRTGLDVSEQVVSAYLWSRGVQRLDAVALSHAHQDHLDGLRAVLRNFRVGELWLGRDVASPAYAALLQEAQQRGARVVHRGQGDRFAWGDVRVALLWPERQAGPPAAAAHNNDSLVLRLDYGATSVLLPGDIEREVERRLLADGAPLDVDVLKVPHHGSRTSASRGFLDAVTPQAAAISLSATNPFGHPHREVLERLAATGARVLRTDRDGAITFSSDGSRWSVTAFVADSATPH